MAGFDYIACRQLLAALKERYPVDVRFAVLPDEQFEAATDDAKSLMIQESVILSGEYQVLIIEDFLWVETPETSPRVNASCLRAFLHMGGVAIFLFNEETAVVNRTPDLDTYNAFLQNCRFPLLYQTPPSDPILGCRHVIGCDKGLRISENYSTLFSINIDGDYLNYISFPIQAAFKNVNTIVVGRPIQVDCGSRVILAGNPRTTRMLTSGDYWWDECAYHVFAGYNDWGKGCSVLLTGNICNDQVLSLGESDALRFTLNLVETLLAYQRERLGTSENKLHATDTPEPVQIRFCVNQPIPIEETRHYEFKEVTGKNPVGAIVNTSDEYAVAFLNSGGGRIFWGVRNADRVAVGVQLDYEQRDKIRRQVWEKLFTIQPPSTPTKYRVELHPLYDGTEEMHDLCVVELVVPAGKPRTLYSTASNDVFVKTDGGKKKLTLQEALEEDRRRRGT